MQRFFFSLLFLLAYEVFLVFLSLRVKNSCYKMAQDGFAGIPGLGDPAAGFQGMACPLHLAGVNFVGFCMGDMSALPDLANPTNRKTWDTFLWRILESQLGDGTSCFFDEVIYFLLGAAPVFFSPARGVTPFPGGGP